MSDAAPALTGRDPRVPPERLVAELVPPPRFDTVRFATYRPDPAQPSQAAAVERLEAFAASVGRPARRRLLGRRRPQTAGGVYLDGGFGVGKTHLLASTWFAAPGRRAYGTFVAFTNLVGALGFQPTVDALGDCSLVCIDEFELDDPGDTVLMSTLLARLAERGVALAATSNTLPGALGEDASPPTTSCARSSGSPSGSTSCGSTATTTGTAACPHHPSRWRSRAHAPGPPSGPAPRSTTSTRCATTWRRCTPAGTARWSTASPASPSPACTPWPTRTSRCAWWCSPTGSTTSTCRWSSAATASTGCSPTSLLQGGYRKKYLRSLSRLTALAREAAPAS
nr:AFG1/ZapE family ATPase [Angustibacter aerolatus]